MISSSNFSFAELAWPHKGDAVHPPYILIHGVDRYEASPNQFEELFNRFHEVGIVDNCVVGKIITGKLFPLIDFRADLDFKLGRVKLQLNDNIANETVPILRDDPINNQFFVSVWRGNIRHAQYCQFEEFFLWQLRESRRY